MAAIPDLKAASYDVCGFVRMADAGYKAKVGSDCVPCMCILVDASWYLWEVGIVVHHIILVIYFLLS